MNPSSYKEICDSIYRDIYSQLKLRDDDKRRFATKSTAGEVLKHDTLVLFFKALSSNRHVPEDRFGISPERFSERVDQRNLHNFLATLIFASCSVQAAVAFAKNLVACDQWPITFDGGKELGSLPADRHELARIFGDDDIVNIDRFSTTQACFSTIILVKGQEVQFQDTMDRRLPYLEQTYLNKGQFGEVYKVKVARGHFVNLRPARENENMEWLVARKDYKTTSEYAKERETIGKILRSSVQCENILQSLGSLKVGDIYSLFMDLAVCDLSKYMTEMYSTAPTSISAKAEVILCAAGLARGLDYLHNKIETPDLQSFVCYHMDLKPSNILVFRGRDDRFIWKLSDFGMSRVKERRGDRGGENVRDFNRLFQRQERRPRDLSASKTVNQAGEGTYLAPEAGAGNAVMGTESDIWSLGGVLSVVFVYLEHGGDAVDAYSDARLEHRNSSGYDRFYVGGGLFSRKEAHPEVKRWHKDLVSRATKRSSAEGKALSSMLDFLEGSVLKMDMSRRCTAEELHEELRGLYKKYESLREEASDQSVQKKKPRIWARKTQSHVESWPIDTRETFKGCAVSPSGTIVAYWTDTDILIFTSEPQLPENGKAIRPGPRYKAINSQWQSICLTDEYLIAATKGKQFDFYIFALKEGIANGPNFEKEYRVTVPVLEIRSLAISPDSRWMVCVGYNTPEQALVYYAPVEIVISYFRNQEGSLLDSISHITGTSVSSSSSPWKGAELDGAAKEVDEVLFPCSATVYFVVRPELHSRSRKNIIKIISFSLEFEKFTQLPIGSPTDEEARSVDRSQTSGLLTTFAPFHKEHRCAVITRERLLYIRNLAREDPTDAEGDIEGYRILKLMIDYRDERFLALGTKSGSNALLLIEIGRPQSSRVRASELARLPGLDNRSEYTAALSRKRNGQDEDEEQHLLMAALVAPSRRAIYRVQIPHSSRALRW